MAGGPWLPKLPPEYQALINQGNYRRALEKTGQEVAKELKQQGRRIIKPVGEAIKAGLERGGMAEEAAEAAEALETLTLSEEAIEGAALARSCWIASEALGAGWAGIAGAAAGAAPVIVPLLCICLLGGLLMLCTAQPVVAQPLRQERRRIALGTGLRSPVFRIQPGVVHSDQRLKQNISLHSQTNCGVPLYTFNYVGSAQTFLGVIAQDLLAVPDLAGFVSRDDAGWFCVDYHAIGLNFDMEMQVAGAACAAVYA